MTASRILPINESRFVERTSLPRATRLEINADEFRASFNRRPFLIGHRLTCHPLFELPRLVELAARLPEDCVAYNAGDVAVAEGIYRGPRTGLSVAETIRRIEDCRSWMVLKRVEADPEYKALLNECLDEVARLSEPMAPGMCKREGFIFISSPGSVTPYHLDPEYNFLLQVRGSKSVHIWNPDDRSVLSEEEIEAYWEDQKNITFRDEYEQRASVFELTPAHGLHFPVTAPHWIQNGEGVSVSFSITFQTPTNERRAIVHGMNAALRRRGWKPTPAGRSGMLDVLKYNAWRVRRRLQRTSSK